MVLAIRVIGQNNALEEPHHMTPTCQDPTEDGRMAAILVPKLHTFVRSSKTMPSGHLVKQTKIILRTNTHLMSPPDPTQDG